MKNNTENRVALSAEQSREGEASTSALQMLVDARKLIELPINWLPRDASGANGCYCMFRAVQQVAGELDGSYTAESCAAMEQAIGAIENVIGTSSVGNWNDCHTHTEVLTAFDKAIKALRAKSPKVNHG